MLISGAIGWPAALDMHRSVRRGALTVSLSFLHLPHSAFNRAPKFEYAVYKFDEQICDKYQKNLSQ